MRTKLTEGEIRGFGRAAARNGTPAGRAYRELCRAYRVPAGSWATFADAYDLELDEMRDA